MKTSTIYCVLIGLAVPLTAHADFWSDDAGRLNERLGDFNHAFGITTHGVIDRASFEKAGHPGGSSYFTDSTHWPSYQCGDVVKTISDLFYTTHTGKPSAVRVGLKGLKTIRCVAGPKNVVVSGDSMTVTLDSTSGENDAPMVVDAMIHAFPDSAWDDADEDIKDAFEHIKTACGITATFSYDKPHVNALSYKEHVQTAANACSDVLGVFSVGCEHNSKVKAAVKNVKSFVCTGGLGRAVQIDPKQVKDLRHRVQAKPVRDRSAGDQLDPRQGRPRVRQDLDLVTAHFDRQQGRSRHAVLQSTSTSASSTTVPRYVSVAVT